MMPSQRTAQCPKRRFPKASNLSPYPLSDPTGRKMRSKECEVPRTALRNGKREGRLLRSGGGTIGGVVELVGRHLRSFFSECVVRECKFTSSLELLTNLLVDNSLAVALAICIPRVPGFSFNAQTPLSNATSSTLPFAFSRTPANFTFPALLNIQIDTHSNVIPMHISKLHTDIYDINTDVKVGEGDLEGGMTIGAKKFQPVSVPVVFSYIAPNASDTTCESSLFLFGPPFSLPPVSLDPRLLWKFFLFYYSFIRPLGFAWLGLGRVCHLVMGLAGGRWARSFGRSVEWDLHFLPRVYFTRE